VQADLGDAGRVVGALVKVGVAVFLLLVQCSSDVVKVQMS
jgi:hypothetical protein